jgi:hypothetical protein
VLCMSCCFRSTKRNMDPKHKRANELLAKSIVRLIRQKSQLT